MIPEKFGKVYTDHKGRIRFARTRSGRTVTRRKIRDAGKNAPASNWREILRDIRHNCAEISLRYHINPRTGRKCYGAARTSKMRQSLPQTEKGISYLYHVVKCTECVFTLYGIMPARERFPGKKTKKSK